MITVKADGYMGVHYMGWGFLHLFEILHSKQIKSYFVFVWFCFLYFKEEQIKPKAQKPEGKTGGSESRGSGPPAAPGVPAD